MRVTELFVILVEFEQVNYGDCMPESADPNCWERIVASFRVLLTI